MRKRAGKTRCPRLALDVLEERTLLSGFAASEIEVHCAGAARSFVLAPAPAPAATAAVSEGAVDWTAPAAGTLATAHVIAFRAGGWSAPPDAPAMTAPVLAGGSEEVGPVSLSAATAPGPMVIVAHPSGWGVFDVPLAKFALRNLAPSPMQASVTETTDESAGPYGPQGPAGVTVTVFVPGIHSFADIPAVLPTPPFHVMVGGEHALTDLPPDARYESYHVTNDAQDPNGESGQVLSQVEGVIGAGSNPAASPAHDARDIAPLSAMNDTMAVTPAVSLRGATVVQEHVLALELAKGSDRPLVPLQVPVLAMAVGEGMTGAVVEAARAVQNAASAVFGGRSPAEAVVVSAAAPQAELQAPAPQGVGLVAEVLPFDGNAVAEAIDRFFDRFEDPDADSSQAREPASLYPPPGVVLLAAAGLELARRRWKRKRDESAAERRGRGDVKGLGFDESFGSSGPWSSRLS